MTNPETVEVNINEGDVVSISRDGIVWKTVPYEKINLAKEIYRMMYGGYWLRVESSKDEDD